MSAIFHLFNELDVYEVSLKGTVVTRISRYMNGSSLREDMEYEELPVNVQQELIKRAKEILAVERGEEDV
jgi:hypothetical protein